MESFEEFRKFIFLYHADLMRLQRLTHPLGTTNRMPSDSQIESTLATLRLRIRETLASMSEDKGIQFDVFISYRRSESHSIAAQVFATLRRGRHPRSGKALRVFLDDERIKAGQNIHVTLNTAISSSATFVILLTPTYSKTEYTAFEEMLIAGLDWGGMQERVFPVLLQDCEIPKRLQAVKYFDLRASTTQPDKETSEDERSLIQMHCIRVSQQQFATHLARHLGVDSIRGFKFVECTGDLVPEQSYLELNDGITISFSTFDIEAAISSVSAEAAKSLIQDGFKRSGFVVKRYATYYGEDIQLPKDEPIQILFEKLNGGLNTATEKKLGDSLFYYARDLPSDFDRSELNALPEPSPSTDVVDELISREAWDTLNYWIGVEVGSFSPGVAILWLCRVVKQREKITDMAMLENLEESEPRDPAAIRTWAKQLLEILELTPFPDNA